MSRIKSKHGNLLNYFIHDKRDLSPAYVRNCKKFLKEISAKLQAPSAKLQARPALMMPQLKSIINLERKNYENIKTRMAGQS